MKFPKTSTGYNLSFFKKQVTTEMKFTATKDEMYIFLSMDELMSIKLQKKLFRIEAIIFSNLMFKLWF